MAEELTPLQQWYQEMQARKAAESQATDGYTVTDSGRYQVIDPVTGQKYQTNDRLYAEKMALATEGELQNPMGMPGMDTIINEYGRDADGNLIGENQPSPFGGGTAMPWPYVNPDGSPGPLTVDEEGNRGSLPGPGSSQHSPIIEPPSEEPVLPPDTPPPPGGPWVPPSTQPPPYPPPGGGGKGNLPPINVYGGKGGQQQPTMPPPNPYPMYGYNRPYGGGGMPMQYTLEGPQAVQPAPMPQRPSLEEIRSMPITTYPTGKGGGKGGYPTYADGGQVMDWRAQNNTGYQAPTGREYVGDMSNIDTSMQGTMDGRPFGSSSLSVSSLPTAELSTQYGPSTGITGGLTGDIGFSPEPSIEQPDSSGMGSVTGFNNPYASGIFGGGGYSGPAGKGGYRNPYAGGLFGGGGYSGPSGKGGYRNPYASSYGTGSYGGPSGKGGYRNPYAQQSYGGKGGQRQYQHPEGSWGDTSRPFDYFNGGGYNPSIQDQLSVRQQGYGGTPTGPLDMMSHGGSGAADQAALAAGAMQPPTGMQSNYDMTQQPGYVGIPYGRPYQDANGNWQQPV